VAVVRRERFMGRAGRETQKPARPLRRRRRGSTGFLSELVAAWTYEQLVAAHVAIWGAPPRSKNLKYLRERIGFRLDEMERRRRGGTAEAKGAPLPLLEAANQEPLVGHPDDRVEDTLRRMEAWRLDSIPIVDELRRLVGVVTRRNLLLLHRRRSRSRDSSSPCLGGQLPLLSEPPAEDAGMDTERPRWRRHS
jgi:CBS domain-containing protein